MRMEKWGGKFKENSPCEMLKREVRATSLKAMDIVENDQLNIYAICVESESLQEAERMNSSRVSCGCQKA